MRVNDVRVFTCLMLANGAMFVLTFWAMLDAIDDSQWWWAVAFGLLAGFFCGADLTLVDMWRQRRKGST